MWWKVNEDGKAVGSPGTGGILQCEKSSYEDWTHMYEVTGLWWIEMSLSRPPGPWADEGNMSWDGNLSTSGRSVGWGLGQVEFRGCFVLLLSH